MERMADFYDQMVEKYKDRVELAAQIPQNAWTEDGYVARYITCWEIAKEYALYVDRHEKMNFTYGLAQMLYRNINEGDKYERNCM